MSAKIETKTNLVTDIVIPAVVAIAVLVGLIQLGFSFVDTPASDGELQQEVTAISAFGS